MSPTPAPPLPPLLPLEPLGPLISPTFQMFLDRAPDVFLWAAGLLVAAFAIVYRIFFQWNATAAGRALGRFAASLAAVLVLFTLTTVFGQQYPLRWLIRGAVYAWVLVSTAELLVVLLRSGGYWFSRPKDPIVIQPKPSTGPVPTKKHPE